MNLKNGKITIGEILDNPKARAILEEEFPSFVNHPLLKNARNMTLDYIKMISRGYISPSKMTKIITKLSNI